MKKTFLFACIMSLVALTTNWASASVIEYGDEDLCNNSYSYSSSPKDGATLEGLAADVVTLATHSFGHNFPFSPEAGDYPGTDQIYVGNTQTNYHDGYSGSDSRINGPQVITLDYSSLISENETVATFTLGIAADDFQYSTWGQPFTASINGVVNTTLSNAINSLSETGPYTHFLTIGIDPMSLSTNNILTLSIDEGGDGSDGWAIDFLTVGVTTQTVPEPSTAVLFGIAAISLIGFIRCRRQA